jgi:hypothetical protein
MALLKTGATIIDKSPGTNEMDIKRATTSAAGSTCRRGMVTNTPPKFKAWLIAHHPSSALCKHCNVINTQS